MIPCEFYLTSTPFSDTKQFTYEIDLPPAREKSSFNLLDDEYSTIHYVIDTIPNSSSGHQLSTQAKKNVWIIAINGEYPITTQGTLDELQRHHNQRGKYKVNISLLRRKRYHMTHLERIWTIFDQIRPVVSHIEVSIPEKPLTPNNIGEAIKFPQRQ